MGFGWSAAVAASEAKSRFSFRFQISNLSFSFPSSKQLGNEK
jgi:hypothetical protein